MQINRLSATTNYSNKKQPAFSSFESIGKTLANSIGQTKGTKSWLGKFSNGVEFNKFSMKMPAMIALLYGATVIPRFVQAHDKHERREVLTRDLISITAILFFAESLKKGFSRSFSNKTGFVLNTIGKETLEGLKGLKRKWTIINPWPSKGVKVLTGSEITAKYSDLKGYKDGAMGFFDFVKANSGDLNKILSADKTIKASAEKIIKKDLKEATFDEIKESFKNAHSNESLKPEVENFYKLFEDGHNPIATKAKSMNSLFDFLSMIILVPGFMICLQKFNERMTKKIIAKDMAKTATENQSTQAAPADQSATTEQKPFAAENAIKTAQNSSSENTKKTYAYFLGENK